MTSNNLHHRPGSLVVVQRVRPGFEEAYRDWSRRINTACTQYPGFVDIEVFEPSSGDDSFVIVVHFETDEEGLAWQNSQECKDLLKAAQPFLTHAAIHAPSAVFGTWFNPPAPGKKPSQPWKEALGVLFVLYPTVMLLSLFVTPLMKTWPMAVSMYVGNLLSIILLTWVFMPQVNRLLGFWLTPPRESGMGNTLSGLAITLGGGALMIALFYAFT